MGCSSSVPIRDEPQARAKPQVIQRRCSSNDIQVPPQGLGPMQKPQRQRSQEEGSSQIDIDTGKKRTSEQPPQDNDDGKLFEDAEFPATVGTITTDASHEKYKHFQEALWRRPPEIMSCGYDEIKIFDSIDVNDIAQGILGNCYFLASLSGLAEEPERVKPIIQTSAVNKSGKYAVRFYVRGVPTIITVDDRFPCFNYNPFEPLFSKPKGKELWAILIEKAWAKLFKSYTNIESGTVEEALEHLTGAPSFSFKTEKHSDDEIWNRLKQADLKKYIIGASSRGNVQRSTGIVENHAYTVVSVHEVEGHKLLKLRNPWGKFEWKGDFSDSSPLWTESLKKAVGYENSDNGMFFMTLKDFRNFYDDYATHHYYDNWHYSYIEQKSGPKHANYYKFTVDKPCEAYFRIHQKDPRFLSQSEQESYKASPASFMIVKVEKDGQYKLVLDSDIETDAHLAHGGTSIFMKKEGKVEIKEAGDYIIRAKVLWRHGKEDSCTISAYSSTKIDLKRITSVKDFQTKYLTLLAAKNNEENPLINQSVSVVGSYEGYVYAMVKNREDKKLTCSIELTQMDNLKLAKPNKVSENKFTLNVAPGSSQLVFLKVTDRSQGCAYEWSWDCEL